MKHKKCLLSMILLGILPLNVLTVTRVSAGRLPSGHTKTKFIIFEIPGSGIKKVYRLEDKGKITLVSNKKPPENKAFKIVDILVQKNTHPNETIDFEKEHMEPLPSGIEFEEIKENS